MMKNFKAFSLWYFKPDEKNPFPVIENNKKFFETFEVVTPTEINKILQSSSALRNILPNWDKISSWVTQSDLARLIYIYENGGFYFDSDCEIIKEFASCVDPNKATLFIEKIVPDVACLSDLECKDDCRRVRIANYAFGSHLPKNPFIFECINECYARLTKLNFQLKNESEILWSCGPDVITSVFHSRKFEVNLLDTRYLRHGCHGSWRC